MYFKCFNSTKVQLEQRFTDFLEFDFIRFNSTKVQLEQDIFLCSLTLT